MKTRTKLAVAVSTALWLVPIGQAFAGIDFPAGDWKVDLSGNVNAFYVGANCDNGANTAVVGGLACTGNDSAAVRNGLLPAAFVFSATSRQGDYDVGVTIGFYPGINSSAAAGVNGAGQPSALATPGIDARQAFFTFGDASWGTIKMGRDIGIFAKDAILDDMTLLGVGSAGANAAPGNTSLGRIGYGYIYTDWLPQITYISPSWSGFQISGGIFQPLESLGTFIPYARHNSPQLQGGISYSWGDPKADSVTGKVWFDGVSQKLQSNAADVPAAATAAGAKTSFTGTGWDLGIKAGFGGFEAVLYGYSGSGLGTTGLYVLPVSGLGSKRDSDGGYAQLTWKWDRLKLGASYGESRLKLASDEKVFINPVPDYITPNLVDKNKSWVGGLYYSLTKSITLVGEYVDSKSTAHDGINKAEEKTFVLGGILFF